LLVIPIARTLIGGSAAFLPGVPQDWLLLASGLVATLLLLPSQAGNTRRILDAPQHLRNRSGL